MPSQGPAFFTSVSQTTTSNVDWTTLTNVLSDAPSEASSAIVLSPDTSETMYLTGPDFTMPPEYDITNISLEIGDCGFSDGLYGAASLYVQINNGSWKLISLGFGSNETLSGDLSYWGISESEAKAMLEDTGVGRVEIYGTVTSDWINFISFGYVKVEVTYDLPQGSGIITVGPL